MYRIYLTDEDTVSSIFERIKSSPESDICLVVFSKDHSAVGAANLKLFKEAASLLGRTLVISSNDEVVRLSAEKAGLKLEKMPEKFNNFKKAFPSKADPVRPKTGNININMNNSNMRRSVDSVGFGKKSVSAEKQFVFKPVPRGEYASEINHVEERNVSRVNKGLLTVFSLIAIAIVGALIYIFIPTAQITVIPRTESMSIKFEMILDKNAGAANKAEKIAPASIIVANTEKSGQFNATGKKEVTAKAAGIVTVYNEWSSYPQSLVVSTRLLAENGKLFRTTKTVVIPGFIRDENGKDIPGSIDAPVIAAEAGPDYNIDPADFTLPAFKGTSKYQKIYAKSAEAFSGGAMGFATVVTDADLKKAKDYLADQAEKDILGQLNDKKPIDLIMLPEAMSMADGNFEASAKADQVVGKFKASFKKTATAYLFNPSHVKEIANEIFATEGRDKKISMISADPELDYSDVLMQGTDKVKMTVSAKTLGYDSVDAERIKSNLLGKSKEEIGNYIKSDAPEIEKVKITLWPFWVKKVPAFERNVKISLDIPPAQ